ncbi:DUF5924 family protein, partial [Pseudomonas syringae pv. tagetis]
MRVGLVGGGVVFLLVWFGGLFAVFGLVSGFSSFFVVVRLAGLASWIAVVLLISWLWLMVE